MARTKSELNFKTFSDFPTVGGSNILYIATDTNLIYRWNGSAYVLVGDGVATTPNLQQVTDVGSTTTNDIEANSFITTGGVNTEVVAGDGTLIPLSSITTAPGGSDGQVQYNNGGVFNGFGKWDNANNYLGVNQDTPLASVHAGLITATSTTPSGFSFTYEAKDSNGYFFTESPLDYYLYSYRSVGAGTVYSSSTYTSCIAPFSSIFDPTNLAGNINTSGSGYTQSGQNLNYVVYAIYGSKISPDSTSVAVNLDYSGNPCSVDLTWDHPSNGPASSYLIILNSTYSTISYTNSVVDDNTWGSYGGGDVSIDSWAPVFTWDADPLAAGFILYESVYVRYTTITSSPVTDNNDGSWTSGTPDTTPTSISTPSLYSDGTTELLKSGTGDLGFWNATAVPQQSGDIRTALSNYGLVTSGVYDTGGLNGVVAIAQGGTNNTSYTTNQIPYFNGSSISGSSGLWKSNAGLAINLSSNGLDVIHAHRPANAASLAWFTNNTTGTTGTAGMKVGITSAGAGDMMVVGNQAMSFGTNNAARWNISSSGHFLANTDNTLDIGASGATRPRTAYFGTSIFSPLVTGATAGSGTLTLSSTSNATKGKILFGTSAYDEVNNRLIVGGTSSSYKFETIGTASIAERTWAINTKPVMFLPDQTSGQFLGSLYIGDGGRSATAGAQANLGVGFGSGISITSGSENTMIGYYAGSAITTGIRGVYIGTYAGALVTSGGENLYMGYAAGYNTTTAGGNSAIGGSALRYNQTGGANVAIGFTALGTGGVIADVANTVGIGYSSGYYTTGTSYGVYIGMFSGYANTTGQANTIIGAYTGYSNQTGSNNTFIGFEAGLGVASNSHSGNTSIGRYSLYGVTTGSYNTTIGTDTGFSLTTGASNVFMGYQTGYYTTTGSQNVLVGYAVHAPSASTSNFMSLGNLIFATGVDGTGTTISSGKVGVAAPNPVAKFQVGTAASVLSNPNGISIVGGDLNIDNGAGATDNTIYFRYQSSLSKIKSDAGITIQTGGANDRITATSTGNIGINTSSYGSGVKVVAIGNASTVPSTNPTAGGVLYSEAGALKWRGSSGTVTTIAVA